MKDNIHPTYYPTATVTCACGNQFVTGSTMAEIHTEICSACHPFFTGKQKLLDTTGNVDRFRQRVAKAQAAAASKPQKKPRKVRAAASR